MVLLVGVLSVLAKVLTWDVSFWNILWPSTMLVYGVRWLLSKCSFASVVCTLLGGYFLLDNLNIWSFSIGNELIFPIVIVIFGLSLLIDALRKPKKPKFTVSRNGVKLNDAETTQNTFETEADSFESNLSFGENVHCVELPILREGSASCSFGQLTVDLTGCQSVAADCELELECAFGTLELLVPKRFSVNPDRSAAFGSIDISGHPDELPQGVINLSASVSFGQIKIQYV